MSSIDLVYSSSIAREIFDLIKDLSTYLLEYELIFREVFL